MGGKLDRIIVGDCVATLQGDQVPPADLIFADPPFNIDYNYDEYVDRKPRPAYLDWSARWMAAAVDALAPTGSLWVAIGDEYAADLRNIGRDLGLNFRNWIVWHYTFGQATQKKFARCHAHILYWTKAKTGYTFNDLAVRVPSDRQTKYNDARADPRGKMPPDVWTFPRVCGTFKERVKFHPCQMPAAILERIVRVSSNPGDLVVDPFSGSGTTCAVAAAEGRRYLGIEMSKAYAAGSRKRIAQMKGKK
jgi:DNA modification methylase